MEQRAYYAKSTVNPAEIAMASEPPAALQHHYRSGSA